MGCFAAAAGKNISASHHVIVGHNEDDFGRYTVLHGYVQARDWNLDDPEEAFLPAEAGRAAVPQVPHTNAFYWIEYVGNERGSSVADAFYNECGVYVTSDSARSSKADLNDPSWVKEGGIEYNLRRTVAERAHSARHGAEIALQMLAEWGYAPGGRMYIIADKDEIWNVQAAHGRCYAAARIPDDGLMILPNHFTIHNLREFPCSMALDPHHPQIPADLDFSRGAILYPADLIDTALAKGWYKPVKEGDDTDFDYAFVFQAREEWKDPVNTLRQNRGMHLVLGESWRELIGTDPFAGIHEDSDQAFYPFCVYPRQKMDIQRMRTILTSHTEDIPCSDDARTHEWSQHDPSFGRTICYFSTCESNIAAFEEDPRLTTLWTAPGRGCQQSYIPLHPLNGIPREFDQMADSAWQLREHLNSHPEINCFSGSAWCCFQRIMHLAELQTQSVSKALTEKLNAFAACAERENHAVILAVQASLSAGEAVRALLQNFDQRLASAALSLLTDFESEFIQPIRIFSSLDPISRSESPDSVPLQFSLPVGQKPLEDGLFFGQGNAQYLEQSVRVCSRGLRQLSQTDWSVDFQSHDILACVFAEGCYDYYLKIKTTSGRIFCGSVLLHFTE